MATTHSPCPWPLRGLRTRGRGGWHADAVVTESIQNADPDVVSYLQQTVGRANAEPFLGAPAGTVRIDCVSLRLAVPASGASDSEPGLAPGLAADVGIGCTIPLRHGEPARESFARLAELLAAETLAQNRQQSVGSTD